MKLVRATPPKRSFLYLAPFIDVLLLLVAFIPLCTGFLLQPGVAVAVPQSPFLLSPQRHPVVVAVTGPPRSAVFYENKRISLEDLRQKLRAREHSPSVIIMADRHAPYEIVYQIVTIALEEGIQPVLAAAPHE